MMPARRITMTVPIEVEILMEVPHPPGIGKQFMGEAYDYAGDVAESAATYVQKFLGENLRWNGTEWPDVKRVLRKSPDVVQQQMKIVRELTGEEIY